jgi:hypothetical protein
VASTPESGLWRAFKAAAPPKTFLQRIENRHGGGIPDVYVLLDKLPVWAELKVTNRQHLKVSPHQVAWHTAYWARGGLSYFLAKPSSPRNYVLFPGSAALDLAQRPWTEVPGERFETLFEVWEYLRTEVRGHYRGVLRP